VSSASSWASSVPGPAVWTTTRRSLPATRKTLATALTSGQAADSPQFTTVLGRIRVPRRSGPGRPRTRPTRVLGDKAYSARANRAYLRRRGIPATIPVKVDQQADRRKKAPPVDDRHRSTRPLPAAACRRMRHQPAQTAPRLRHPLRQARRPLRGRRRDQRYRHLAARPFTQGLAGWLSLVITYQEARPEVDFSCPRTAFVGGDDLGAAGLDRGRLPRQGARIPEVLGPSRLLQRTKTQQSDPRKTPPGNAGVLLHLWHGAARVSSAGHPTDHSYSPAGCAHRRSGPRVGPGPVGPSHSPPGGTSCELRVAERSPRGCGWCWVR
jgi:hypothetical protein